jgi:FkbM family methyltransferase
VAVIQPSRIKVNCDKGSFKSVIYDSSVPNNRDAVSVEIENKGFAFDQEAREIMAALNAHPGPFLDIGANLGWFTTMVTACTDKITYAIEPFVENFNRILASACENEVPSSRLHACNIGLDTKFSKCSLYQVPDHNKGDTHSICDEEQKAAFAARNYIELGIMQTAPLDSLYSSGQLGDIPFSLMKIDVEVSLDEVG